MITIENLVQATFKGIEFACNDSDTTVGAALIKHEFANSNKNNMEFQGKNPRVYKLTAIFLGDNYVDNRDALLEAVESGTPGVLLHPFYGRIENAVALPATLTESTKTLGRAELPITFEISDSEGIPTATLTSTAGIRSRRSTTVSSVSQDFSETFNVSSSRPNNFSDAVSKATDFADAIDSLVTIRSISNRNSAGYRARSSNYRRNINSLISEPGEMGGEITGLMEDITTLYETPEETYDVARRFFAFGDNDTAINQTTAGLAERQRNRTAINEAVQVSALSVAYDAASQIEFGTVSEVDGVSRELEAQYRKLIL